MKTDAITECIFLNNIFKHYQYYAASS